MLRQEGTIIGNGSDLAVRQDGRATSAGYVAIPICEQASGIYATFRDKHIDTYTHVTYLESISTNHILGISMHRSSNQNRKWLISTAATMIEMAA